MTMFSRESQFSTRGAVWFGVGLLLCTAGCGWPNGSPRLREPKIPLLALGAKLDKETYRPGEAVVCTVALSNPSKKAVPVAALSADTLEFWFGPAGTDLRFRRVPVRSAKEKACEGVPLAPGETVQRDFLLPDVTEEEAVDAIHVFYRPACEKQPESPSYIAPAVLYRVDGDVLLRRDKRGVLLETQAIALAKEWADSPVSEVDAVLIRNEAGFLDWWGTLDVDEAAEPEPDVPRRAVLINAHTGKVRAEAKPRPGPLTESAGREKGGLAQD